MFPAIRRIVTDHDEHGNAIFVSDEMLESVDPTTEPRFQPTTADSMFGVMQIHRSRRFSVDNQKPLKDPHKTLIPLADTKGASCRLFDVPPGNDGWLHRTVSLDYAFIVSGEPVLILDNGVEKQLKRDNVVVLRGGNHAWANRGKENARVFSVLVPSKEIVTKDGQSLKKTPAGDVYDPEEEDD